MTINISLYQKSQRWSIFKWDCIAFWVLCWKRNEIVWTQHCFCWSHLLLWYLWHKRTKEENKRWFESHAYAFIFPFLSLLRGFLFVHIKNGNLYTVLLKEIICIPHLYTVHQERVSMLWWPYLIFNHFKCCQNMKTHTIKYQVQVELNRKNLLSRWNLKRCPLNHFQLFDRNQMAII